MRLARLSEFRRIHYTPGSAPTPATLRAWIDKGRLPGGVVQNGRYYVDLDEFERATQARRGLADAQAQLEKNPLLEGLV